MSKNLFDVAVIATMSAGKSTVINALLGKELLHSANEATTATITRIHDQDHLPFFSGSAYSYQNELLEESHKIDADTMKKWNADPNIKLIDIAGDIQALHNDAMDIVIYDTPGPNNSQDESHENLTMEVINDGNYGLILYVLNATQLGVNDDKSLLEKIQATLEKDPHKQIIFLLNKADCLDEEKGERLDKVVANAQKYLINIGFNKPTIIPTAAHYALILQKMLNNTPLTRTERADVNIALNSLNDNLIIASTIETTQKLKILNKLKKTKAIGRVKFANGTITKQRLSKSIMRTGFGVVQYLLQQRLSKTPF
ncbi:dynamin family protein [Ursidibacter arcticus]